MTVALSPTFYDFSRVAERHVAQARPKLAFARALARSLLDGLASRVLRRLNTSLDRDVVRMRGLRASLELTDQNEVLDPGSRCYSWLKMLEENVLELQGEALTAKTVRSLKASHIEICRTAELCGELHEAIVELRLALADHDMKATAVLSGAGTLIYELSDRQAEQFEECKTSEREPTARMREAARRYDALVTSR